MADYFETRMLALGDKLDRVDRRLAKIIASNEWPHKHPSNWLATYGVQQVMFAQCEAKCCYYGVSRANWLEDQEEMQPRKPNRIQVCQRWRAVLTARQAVADLASDASSRERVDAEIAVEAAEGLYDIVSRVFEGKRPRTWEERRGYFRLSPPKRPAPGSTKRRTLTRSTYIGA
jgi:hypothetical protein